MQKIRAQKSLVKARCLIPGSIHTWQGMDWLSYLRGFKNIHTQCQQNSHPKVMNIKFNLFHPAKVLQANKNTWNLMFYVKSSRLRNNRFKDYKYNFTLYLKRQMLMAAKI